MTHDHRAEAMRQRRAELKEKIAAELARPNPDEVTVRRLKLEKCRLKDEIATLERRGGVASAA